MGLRLDKSRGGEASVMETGGKGLSFFDCAVVKCKSKSQKKEDANMKKWITLLLTAVMLLSMTACGGSAESVETTPRNRRSTHNRSHGGTRRGTD